MGWQLDPEEAETRVLHHLANFRGKDVIEIGCGNGRLTWRYAEQARSIVACDPAAGLVEWARAHTPVDWRDRIEFHAADITVMPLPPSTFDVALLAWSIC